MLEGPPQAVRDPAIKIGPGRLETAALFLLAVLAVVWGWWAWKEGAYFGVVLLPGGLVLCFSLALLGALAPWRGNLQLSRPAKVALFALIGLGIWTMLSAFWSPSPDVAVLDGERVLIYAVAFGLGLWLCNLLGPRMELSLLPLVAAAGFAGVVTIIALLGNEPRNLLEIDGTLDYPLGYRNANAAFFAIALFPAVGLAAKRGLDFRARALALGVGSLSFALFLLCQSRASAPALLVALVVYILLSPYRLRAIAWLALALIPALAIIPSLTGLYSAVNDTGMASAIGEMHGAARAAAFIAALGVLIGGLAAHNERRLPILSSRSDRSNRTVGRVLLAIGAVVVIGFVASVGDPIDWAGERATEFRDAGSPDLSGETSRFTFNAGSDRYDLWRVALDDFADDPLFGDGAGGYQYSYLQKRETEYQNARDAHSVELEHLAELGLPGFLLFATAIVAALLAALRSRKLGPSASNLSAIALAVGAYWIVHSSLDWFWPYPAITAPVLMLLGAAAAPAVLALEPAKRQAWRGWAIGGAVVLALAVVPIFLSERYVDNARSEWHADPDRAYRDLDASRALNPLADEPILFEGVIASELGDEERAVAAFREAIEERPEEYAAHYLLAELEADRNPLLARNEARVALELNPLDPRVQQLARRLGAISKE